MFPQGLFIEPENRQYRTLKTNSIFLILSAITSEIGGNDKDSLTKNVNESSIVEYSIEISNISFTPKDFELTNYLIKKLVTKYYL
jgi:hypothetical protein